MAGDGSNPHVCYICQTLQSREASRLRGIHGTWSVGVLPPLVSNHKPAVLVVEHLTTHLTGSSCLVKRSALLGATHTPMHHHRLLGSKIGRDDYALN